MPEEAGNNVINNYKGVMLCSRPNENQNSEVERPFCGRVYNHEQIGLVPCHSDKSPVKEGKKVHSILNRHKKWLQGFKQKQAQAKEQSLNRAREQQQKFHKIKNQAEIDRERSKKMKEQYNQTASNVIQILDNVPSRPAPQTGELTSANLRKLDAQNENEDKQKEESKQKVFRKKKNKQKPMWAMTEQEIEKKQDQQADELLSFFENADIADYSEDEQVKSILHNLRDKIRDLKERENWKEHEASKLDKKEPAQQQRNVEDDKYSHFSASSEAKSVASEKTQNQIDQLRKKKAEAPEWDRHTLSDKKSANIEERIAKNLADEVLRNYPHLKGVHSNTSIRKLLQAEATKVMNEPIPRPVITTIINEPKPLNTSNLPYLHRNPAI